MREEGKEEEDRHITGEYDSYNSGGISGKLRESKAKM